MKVNGQVFNIQRFSLHDGPGIRTTVFLKGCPLRCPWCHNPEGLEDAPQIRVTFNRCTRCGRCAAACRLGGHAITAEGHALQLESCDRCGACVEACPAGAIEMVGRTMAVAEVLATVRRDIPFYRNSDGGMTLSGGEPLRQYRFSRALLAAAKAEGIHTAIETAALDRWERLAALAPSVDLWLVDLKHTDNARHTALTGVPNRRILGNIRRMATEGWPIVLRIPWVPTMNAEPLFLDGLARLLGAFSTPPPVEFLPYHRLGLGKWASLGGCSPIAAAIPAAEQAEIEPWAARLRALGGAVKVG
ncbi:MAG TPA: glycyl-radical enzyme activating protein [Armatimonadota bacterium]|nr:glycyl-radical enzyme activating protein [Armatimonadota bacterium]